MFRQRKNEFRRTIFYCLKVLSSKSTHEIVETFYKNKHKETRVRMILLLMQLLLLLLLTMTIEWGCNLFSKGDTRKFIIIQFWNWLGRRGMMKFQIIISFIRENKLWDNEMAISFQIYSIVISSLLICVDTLKVAW